MHGHKNNREKLDEQCWHRFTHYERMIRKTELPTTLTPDVLIVGAGPVGLLTALKLCLAGLSVTVIEKFTNILEIPRAIAYLLIVNKELYKLGLAEEILKECHICQVGPIWLKMDGTVLGAIGDHSTHNSNLEASNNDEKIKMLDKSTLMIGQDVLSRIVLNALERRCKKTFQIKFGTCAVGIQPFPQDDGLVKVMTNAKDQNGTPMETILTAKWVVGADGAGSFVRKACCIPFEGFTWKNFRFTAADIEYQFNIQGDYRPITYIVDPEEWAVIAKTGRHDVWRICYGERVDLPGDDAAVAERSNQRITRYLPGSKIYKLQRVKPYWAQQRCAKVFRKGRVVLVGDAAHTNNPIGGLGLSGGILDAAAVGNSIARVLMKNGPEELIDAALESRRSVWLEKVGPMSQTNFSRISCEDGSDSERRSFFTILDRSDPSEMASLSAQLEDIFPENFEGKT